jgi:hypothetical protein
MAADAPEHMPGISRRFGSRAQHVPEVPEVPHDIETTYLSMDAGTGTSPAGAATVGPVPLQLLGRNVRMARPSVPSAAIGPLSELFEDEQDSELLGKDHELANRHPLERADRAVLDARHDRTDAQRRLHGSASQRRILDQSCFDGHIDCDWLRSVMGG